MTAVHYETAQTVGESGNLLSSEDGSTHAGGDTHRQ
jgi:hypothetical protein